MSARVTPGEARPVGYPRARAAWKLLAAAAPIAIASAASIAVEGRAAADASVPGASRTPVGKPNPAPSTPARDHRKLGGKVAPVRSLGRLLLHPHEPHEPCFLDGERDA